VENKEGGIFQIAFASLKKGGGMERAMEGNEKI
jgi:hypothetical protein